MPWPTCDVCEHRQAVIVACSGLGPMSLAYCGVCGALGLEPVGLVAAMLAEGVMESGVGAEYAAHSMQVGLMTVHGHPPVSGPVSVTRTENKVSIVGEPPVRS